MQQTSLGFLGLLGDRDLSGVHDPLQRHVLPGVGTACALFERCQGEDPPVAVLHPDWPGCLVADVPARLPGCGRTDEERADEPAQSRDRPARPGAWNALPPGPARAGSVTSRWVGNSGRRWPGPPR